MTEQTESVQAHGKLWSLLDWSFWGAGMGDVFREPLADRMLAAVPAETIAQAEQVMADFIERRKIEKTGVTIYQDQRDELDQARTRIAEVEAQLAEMTRCRDSAVRALYRDDVETDPHLPDLFADGLHGLYEWDDQPEPDQAPQELVDRCVRIVRPAFGKLTQQRDAAHARVAELEAERAKYVGAEPTIAEEMAYLSRCLHAVHDLCNKAEEQAKRWEHPLPVPAWVEQVRKAADGLEPASKTRPALPWAHAMDDGDLHLFLDDLVSAAMGRWRSEPDIPDRQVLADVEKACTDWRTPGQGYRSDEPGSGEGR